MRLTRIYSTEQLAVGREISLDAIASNHLLRVLRLKIGATLKVFDGNGHEYLANLVSDAKRHAVIAITETTPSITESPLALHLGQGISRGEKMDYTIQKAVELGVQKITPLFTEYCGVQLSPERIENRMAHWQAIIINACEQCGRSYLPQLAKPVNLSQWLLENNSDLKLILEPSGDSHLNDLPRQNSAITLLVGPEGGFSEEEITLAKNHDFHAWRFGPRILRTETAAPAAIAVLQSHWGDI